MADLTRKTANLLDYSFITSTRFVTVTPITNGINLTGTYYAEIDIALEVGTTYYMSWDEDVKSGSAYVAWRFQYTDDTFSNLTRPKVALTPAKEIAKVLFYVNSTNTQASVDITNLMLNTGTASLPYEPYGWVHSLRKLTTATEDVENPLYSDGTAITAYTLKGNTVQSGTPTPSNPITISGVGNKTANLFNKATSILNNYVNASTGELVPVSSNLYFASDYIEVEQGETYYWNDVKRGNAGAFYNSNKTYISGWSSSETRYVFTVPSGAKYVRLTGDKADIDTYMLSKGSTAKPYEPYGYKIPILSGGVTTPIYLTEPLMKIGDTVDSLVSSGTATYNIGWIDLGTLDWEIMGSGNFHSTTIITDMKMIANIHTGNAVCTEFSEVDAQSVANVAYSFSSCLNNQRTPFVNKTGFEGMTVAQFKAAMSGVIMYYVKAEATTETVTAPSIPTAEGANSITVDTTVQPSEFTATWTGWHDASVKEKSENLFDYQTMSNGEDNFYLLADGSKYSNDAWRITDYIPCELLSVTLTRGMTNQTPAICGYDENKQYIAGVSYNNNTEITLTSQQTIKYIRFSWRKVNPTEDISQIMLNEGSTALPYEPYWK